MEKTKEEIQALKDNWVQDPNWDIEDTEGFEDYVNDLREFRENREIEWQVEAEAARERRSNIVRVETGISDSAIQQNIQTFGEIKNDVIRAIKGDSSSIEELLAAQVCATLLQAAQLARIADALEEWKEDDESNASLDFMTRLYKV